MSKIRDWIGPIRLFRSAKVNSKKDAFRDLLAGIQLATMNIPQSLGYAKIAGMPVVTGLYALLLPVFGFAAFGSSRFLVVGADSATAAILSGGLQSFVPTSDPDYVTLASAVALLTASFLLAARILKLGFLGDFLSQTVLMGFLTGVGIQVAFAVLGDLTGVGLHSRQPIRVVEELISLSSQIHHPTLLLAMAVIIFVLTSSYLVPRFPAGLLAVGLCIFSSWWFSFADHGVAIIAHVATGLPTLHLPKVTWEQLQNLVPLAGSCVFMIIAQSAATARVYASRHHQEVDVNADLLGLAAANTLSALSGSFVVNGSPTQTAMVEASGSRGQIAQIGTSLVVLTVLLYLSPALQYLPKAALGALIFCTAMRLIDFRGLWKIRSESSGEFVLAVITVITVVGVGVEEGIILAIVLSLLRIVQHSYRPHTGILVKNQIGLWEPMPLGDCSHESYPGVVIYRFGASLFYANSSFFADEILRIASGPSGPKWIIVDAEAIAKMDYTASRVVLDLHRDLLARKVTLAFARVQPYLRSDMTRHHLTQAIGENRIFPRLHNALEAYQAQGEGPAVGTGMGNKA